MSIGTLLAFVIVSIGIVFLRYQRPELERPFKTPCVPFVPILSALVSLVLMAGLPVDTWLRLIIWMVIGVVIYFVYGYQSAATLRKRDGRGPRPSDSRRCRSEAAAHCSTAAAVAREIRAEVRPGGGGVHARSAGRPPGLGIVLVGDDPASQHLRRAAS